EVRVELRSASGEVDRVGGRPVESSQARFDGVAVHVFADAIRSRVDVTVAARHVAELPEIDLEDLDRRGPQRLAQPGVEAASAGGTRQVETRKRFLLARRRRERRM